MIGLVASVALIFLGALLCATVILSPFGVIAFLMALTTPFVGLAYRAGHCPNCDLTISNFTVRKPCKRCGHKIGLLGGRFVDYTS